MNINLKQYQEKSIKTLTEKIVEFSKRSDDTKRTCVFQAPTGSGKTLMVASIIQNVIAESENNDITFLWMSIGDGELHMQSKRTLDRYFAGSPRVQVIDEVFGTQQTELLKNAVMVASWNKIRSKDSSTGLWKNIVMKDGENINFRDMLDNTQSSGRKIIMIIDEAHSQMNAQRGKEVIDLIKPNVTLEVSATPIIKITSEDIANGNAWHEIVDAQSVIDEGMIKKVVLVNKDLKQEDIDENSTGESALLIQAYNKRLELKKAYGNEGVDINPLVVIQLPNADEGVDKRSEIEMFLQERDINIENGKLAVWLSDDKDKINLDNITNLNATQEFLIFKQSIATGWDCPRAHILVKFRKIGEETFEMQTLGRIMRMPEQVHYENEALNFAYVYTNSKDASFRYETFNPNIIGDRYAKRIDSYENISLNSTFKSRVDYQDITADIRTTLFNYFEKELELKTNSEKKNIDTLNKIKGFNFDTDKISKNTFKDKEVSISDIASGKLSIEAIGEDTLKLGMGENDIFHNFYGELSTLISPFTNIKRSTPILANTWYSFIKSYLGKDFWNDDPTKSQILFLNNKDILRSIIIDAVQEYAKNKTLKSEEESLEYISNFEVGVEYSFSKETHEVIEAYTKSVLQPCYVSKTRSGPEKAFEEFTNLQENVKWWWKNGVNRRDYFGIEYRYKADGKEEIHIFYPDYLVMLNTGKIAILETKHTGDQDGETKTKYKAEALHKYIEKENKKGKNLVGGIVVFRNERWQINSSKTFNLQGDDWSDLKL